MDALTDKVVVITGGSSGIGRATAIAAARRGARVALIARGLDALQSAADEIIHGGGEALPLRADVAMAAEVDAAAAAVLDRWGRIDVWVNGASVGVYGEFTEIPDDEFRRVVDVDLMGTVHGTRAALRAMRGQADGGAIVNVSSGLADRAVPLQGPYCAAKAAVASFSEALRVELEHDGVPVRVAVIKPSSIDTPFFHHARSHMTEAPKPLPPVYDPSLAAEAILYAATHDVREMPVGGGVAGLPALEAAAPALIDRTLVRIGYQIQQDGANGGARAGNLWTPIEGPGSVRGGYGGRRWSLYGLIRLNPAARAAAMAGAAVAGWAVGRGR